ncbi:hypothetical protein E2C01_086778 [Portunus trituberculatus]|uniref:Uncharacterized protein n=1 Tax=Portunus trituberculatus TaxID=210409 RepID=A0A5B7J6A4_PORTR|nr:hypothetical protein [Portunus trituberculatus]
MVSVSAGGGGVGEGKRRGLAACGKWRGGQRAVFMGGRLTGREKVETGRTVRRGKGRGEMGEEEERATEVGGRHY